MANGIMGNIVGLTPCHSVLTVAALAVHPHTVTDDTDHLAEEMLLQTVKLDVLQAALERAPAALDHSLLPEGIHLRQGFVLAMGHTVVLKKIDLKVKRQCTEVAGEGGGGGLHPQLDHIVGQRHVLCQLNLLHKQNVAQLAAHFIESLPAPLVGVGFAKSLNNLSRHVDTAIVTDQLV